MKLKLQFIMLTFIALVIYIPVANGQANLTFSGGNGAPLSITLLQSVSYTVNNSQCVLNGGPIFVFNEAGNPFSTAVQPVTGSMSFSVNSGGAQPITNTRSGVNIGSNITTNDIYVYGNLPNVSSGQTVILSAGTVITTANIAAAPPINGSFTTFIVSGSGAQCSTNGVALPPTAATASISGRVSTSNGRGIRGVRLTLTDFEGKVRTATTTTFGYYQFTDVQVGETYILEAAGKRFNFSQPAQVLSVNGEISEVNFIADSDMQK